MQWYAFWIWLEYFTIGLVIVYQVEIGAVREMVGDQSLCRWPKNWSVNLILVFLYNLYHSAYL